jgi:hypothetical protein
VAIVTFRSAGETRRARVLSVTGVGLCGDLGVLQRHGSRLTGINIGRGGRGSDVATDPEFGAVVGLRYLELGPSESGAGR